MRTLLAYRLSLPLLLVILMTGLLAACGGDDATEVPAPAATTAPVSTTSAPVATAAPSGPTNTPRPTPAAGQIIPTVAPTEALAETGRTWPNAYPKAGENGVPAYVGNFTVVTDSWGSSDLNPWALTGVNFLHDYFNLRLMMQDPNGVLAPAWATSFEQTLRESPSNSILMLSSRTGLLPMERP